MTHSTTTAADTASSRLMRLRYDRGTLRFVDPTRSDAWKALPDVAWDHRTSCYRAPPWRYAEIIEALRRRAVGFIDEVPRYLHVDRGAWRDIELRPYQRAALTAWQMGGRRGMLALPTGSGKTRIALAAMAATGAATLCLVPTRVLLHQWRAEIRRFHAGPVGLWGDGERVRAPIMVITFESAYRHMARLGNQYPLIVVDEAHHFGAGARDEALEMSIAPARLGLSATPPSDPEAATGLERLVGPTVFRTSLHELAGRYLADFEIVPLHIPLDADEEAAYRAEMAVFRPVFAAFRRFAPRAKWTDFLATANKTREGRAAVASWRRGRRLVAFTRGKAEALDALLTQHRDNRVLIFAADNATVYTIARRHLVTPITCDIRRNERELVLERFRSGQLRALVSGRVLNEGIDVPDADIAIIVGGSQGEREHIQRVGRLLRPAPGKKALVYELIADGTSEVRQAQKRRLGLGTTATAAF